MDAFTKHVPYNYLANEVDAMTTWVRQIVSFFSLSLPLSRQVELKQCLVKLLPVLRDLVVVIWSISLCGVDCPGIVVESDDVFGRDASILYAGQA